MYTDLYRVPPTDSALALLDKAQALREERDRLAELLRRFVELMDNELSYTTWTYEKLKGHLLQEADAALYIKHTEGGIYGGAD